MALARKDEIGRIWKQFMEGDVEAFLDAATDNITWVIPGNLPNSGTMTGKAAIREFMKGINKMAPNGVSCTIQRALGDGDTVILQVGIRGDLFNGRLYENDYCLVLDLEGGKIRHIQEYADTQKVVDLMK